MNEPAATSSNGQGRMKRGYSLGEEIANSITHGIGVIFGIVALTLLLVYAVRSGDAWQIASSIVYGITLILLYTASTLYHAFPWPKVKHVFKILDHAGIYLLIAGTYTPFTLVTLRDDGGWAMFIVIWVLAIVGVALEAFWVYRPKWLSAAVYLVLGWLVVFMIKPLVASLEPTGVWLLVAGGLAYTLGAVFYVMKRVPYTHAVWHGFVLGGSVCHFLAVVLFVMPPV